MLNYGFKLHRLKPAWDFLGDVWKSCERCCMENVDRRQGHDNLVVLFTGLHSKLLIEVIEQVAQMVSDRRRRAQLKLPL